MRYKKIVKLITIVIVSSLFFAMPTLAATVRGERLSSVEEESKLLPVDQKSSNSGMKSNTRGEAIAMSILSITNKGGGAIGVLATTALHRDIAWGMTSIYLDLYDTDGKWVCVEEYIYEFPNGNGDSGSITVNFDITNQPAGHYYRLRGIHEIEYLNDNNEMKWEGHSTSTDGVFITKTP